MAVSTLTTSVYLQTPMRANHVQNYVGGQQLSGLSGRTLSDIVFLCKIPNKAVITNWWFRGTHGDTGRAFKLGITGNGTETTFGTVTWVTATIHGLQGTPFKVSISDTDAQAGATVYMTLSTGTWTTSASFEFNFEYRFDVNSGV